MTNKPSMRTFRQEKLWRDNMPAYCEAKGSIITTKKLNDEEFDQELRIKLIEEAGEVRTAPSREELIEEVADIYEAIDALLPLHDISKEEIIAAQDKKRIEKGGYTERTYVTTAQHPAGSYSESYCLSQSDRYPEIKEIMHE